MSGEIYRFLHVASALMILTSLTALWGIHLMGTPTKAIRFGMALTHGLGMLLILISGFARLGQLGLMTQLPAWFYGKLVVWIFLGGSIVLAKRKAKLGLPLFALWLGAAALSAYLGILKP